MRDIEKHLSCWVIGLTLLDDAMRGDAGAARLVTAVDAVRHFQLALADKETKHVSHAAANLLDFSTTCKTPPVCIGYFNITAEPGHGLLGVSVEEFCVPDSCALLVDRIGVIALDDSLLNGSIVGRTLPAPSACELRVWASNLLAADGRFELLAPSSGTPLGSLHFCPQRLLATDRIMLQGRYESLTVCLFGWSLEVGADARLTSGKRFYRQGIAQRVGRLPFSSAALDTCPQDAAALASQIEASQLPIAQTYHHEAVGPAGSKDEEPKTLGLMGSVAGYYEKLSRSEFHRILAAAVSDELQADDQRLFVDVPTIQMMREVATRAVAHIKEFNLVVSIMGEENDEALTSFSRRVFLECSTWRKLFSLVFWPFEESGTYSRYWGLVQEPHTLTKVDDAHDVSKTNGNSSPLPVKYLPLNPWSGTADQKVLCLRLLSALLRESLFVVDLFLFFGGHWALPQMAGLGRLPSSSAPPWPYRSYSFHVAATGKAHPPPTTRIKAAALDLLSSLSSHRKGVLALITPPEPSGDDERTTADGSSAQEDAPPPPSCSVYESLVLEAASNPTFARPQKRRTVTTVLNQVRLHGAITGFITVAGELSRLSDPLCTPRDGLVALLQALSLLTALVQWNPHREQELEELGVVGSAAPRLSGSGGERRDGFGVDNQPWGTRTEDHSVAVRRLAQLTAGTRFLELLVEMRNRMDALQRHAGVMCTADVCLPSKEEPRDDALDVTLQVKRIRRALESLAHGAGVFVDFTSLSSLSLIAPCETLAFRLLEWVFTSSAGLYSVMFQHVCLRCSLLPAEPRPPAPPESGNLGGASFGTCCHDAPLIRGLPSALREMLDRHKRAFLLVARLAATPYGEQLLAAAPNPAVAYTFPSLMTGAFERPSSSPVVEDAPCAVSFRQLHDLATFTQESPANVDALLRLWSCSATLPALLGRLLQHLVSHQLTLERRHATGASSERCASHLAEAISDVAVLTALRYVLHIVWRICTHRQSDPVLRLMSIFCYEPLCALARALCDSDDDGLQEPSPPSDTQHRGIVKELAKHLRLPSHQETSVWGQDDLSLDAYANLKAAPDSHDTAKGGMNMLNCLVPASLFTSLKQVHEHDHTLAVQLVDLLSSMHIVMRSEGHLGIKSVTASAGCVDDAGTTRVLSESSDIFAALDTAISPLLTDDPVASEPAVPLLPTGKQRLEFLITTLASLTEAAIPNRMVPVAESTAQLSATTGSTGTGAGGGAAGPQAPLSALAVRLGGYSATLGVPVIELQCTGSSGTAGGGDAVTTATAAAAAAGAAAAAMAMEAVPASGQQNSCIIPTPVGWRMEVYTCLRLILNELASQTAETSVEQLTAALYGGDETISVLATCCFEAPHLSVQENCATLSASLIRLLNRCSASISPSLFLGHGGSFVHRLEGRDAHRWLQQTRDILPVTRAGLELLYWVLDLCTPSAPFPVAPQSLLPSHQCSSAQGSGAPWVSRFLVDSNLRDGLVLLASRLTQAWVLASRCQPSVFLDQGDSGRTDPPSFPPFGFSSFLTTGRPDATTDRPEYHDLRHCLHLVTAALRLLCARCPDASAALLETILRQSRSSPMCFATGPLLLSAVGGMNLVLPASGATIFFSNHPPPLIATELNGAEGRNLEAVVARLKQVCLQRRQTELARTGGGAGVSNASGISGGASRLPPSMTTLCLSARAHVPLSVQRCLFGERVPHFLVFQIPLAPPVLPQPLPPSAAVPAHTSLAGQQPSAAAGAPAAGRPKSAFSAWTQRRLGRLSMGRDYDILSFSVFHPEALFPVLRHQGPTLSAGDQSNVPEWAGWDRLWELLYDSLEEEAIEQALESDRVPTVPLGLSAADVAGITESRHCAKEMLRLVNDATSLSTEKAQLARLEKMGQRFKQLKVEDIAEFVDLLLMASYTSNNLLHAATAYTLAVLTWTSGPPVLDVVLHVAHSATQHLCSFLARELVAQRSVAISQMFLVSRLLLLADHTFTLFPAPTLEAASCLIRLAAAGLQALQDVPVIDASCPTFPVLMGLFDCLLPASVRLLRRGISTLLAFIGLLRRPTRLSAECGPEPA